MESPENATTYRCRLSGTKRWQTVRVWQHQHPASMFVHNRLGCGPEVSQTNLIEVLEHSATYKVTRDGLMSYVVEAAK